MLRSLRRRMVVKIFLAIGVAVVGALALFAWKQSSSQVSALNQNTRLSAGQLADLVVGSVEHSMLEGKGIKVKELVGGFKTRVPDAMIHVYDPHGMEVFGEKPAPPPPDRIPAAVRAVLAGGARQTDAGRVLRPIAGDERCPKCHQDDQALRGVLALTPLPDAYRAHRPDMLSRLVTDGFERVMTFDKNEAGHRVERYLKELSPTVKVGIYDRDGDLALGEDVGLGDADLQAALVPGAGRRSVARSGGTIELVPLPLEDRCKECHDEKNPVRGLLAMSLDVAPPGGPDPQELEQIVDVSLRNIMDSALGRMIAWFLDGVLATGAVSEVALYDNAGREVYSTVEPKPMPLVAKALSSRGAVAEIEGHGRGERVVVAQPLDNGPHCRRCHAEGDLRGVVTVSLPASSAAAVRSMAMQKTLTFSAIALGIIILVLYALMQIMVVRPVRQIGEAADAIGKGNLEVKIRRADPQGDEVQRLGSRMNDMVQGLRAKFHLERFVSKETAKAAQGAARQTSLGVVARVGERRAATVLFTDIRGFTAFSESVEPERVVEVLNRFLQAQADVVARHGGDIDKYVGDELMAVFHGDDATPRAVRAALEMVAAVNACRRPDETLEVGAGISAGEMIHGPIGSADRLDFTVIGDVVNTGARLCSSAAPSEVLVSAAVRAASAGAMDLAFDPLEPLKLKGKREPFPVWRARSVTGAI